MFTPTSYQAIITDLDHNDVDINFDRVPCITTTVEDGITKRETGFQWRAQLLVVCIEKGPQDVRLRLAAHLRDLAHKIETTNIEG